MNFPDWIMNSIYQRIPLEHGNERADLTWEEIESAMQAAWQAGMKEQYRRERYAQQQQNRVSKV